MPQRLLQNTLGDPQVLAVRSIRCFLDAEFNLALLGWVRIFTPARGSIAVLGVVFYCSTRFSNDSILWLEEFMERRNARVGFVLFVVYLFLYGGFVFLNAFAADVMEWTPIAGVNLAILYGFGLIAAALLLALVYGFLCRERPAEQEVEE